MIGSPGRKSLREQWNERYATYSVEESGCLGAGPRLASLIYRAQERAIGKALGIAGLTRDSLFRVLDMGCGLGYFAGFYHREFPRASYTGIDISTRAVEFAKTRYPADTFAADDVVTWSGAAGARFDVVQSINVLQLLVDDAEFAAAFGNLSAHLETGGVIVVPMAFSDRGSSNELQRFRTRDFFDRLLAELGLAVVAEIPTFYWLIDGGPTGAVARAIFARSGPYSLYLADRLAFALGLVNRRPEHDLSRARTLLIRRRGASDPRTRVSAG
jgi:SAM-dependent methyltransferase